MFTSVIGLRRVWARWLVLIVMLGIPSSVWGSDPTSGRGKAIKPSQNPGAAHQAVELIEFAKRIEEESTQRAGQEALHTPPGVAADGGAVRAGSLVDDQNATGGPTGACCPRCPAGVCFETTSQGVCVGTPGSVWLGFGSTCAADCTPDEHECLSAEMMVLVEGPPGVFRASVMSTPADGPPPSEHHLCDNPSTPAPDALWYELTVPSGIDSVLAKTCNSDADFDASVLSMYCGRCCSPNINEALQSVACGTYECSGKSWICLEGLTNMDGGTDEFANCRNPDGSVSLLMQLSNYSTSDSGTYLLEVAAPCVGSCCDGPTANCEDHVVEAACPTDSQFSTYSDCSHFSIPCGAYACCQPDGSCANVVGAVNCTGGIYYPGAVCDTEFTDGFVCNPANSCDYDHNPPSYNGLTVQVFTDLNVIFEMADNVVLTGSDANSCTVSRIEVHVFHTNHQRPNCDFGGGLTCNDRPDDYEGLVVFIAGSHTGSGGQPEPVCNVRLPIDGVPPFHEPLGPDCREFVFGQDSNGNIPSKGNHWTWTSCFFGKCGHYIDLHFDPPIELAKNTTYWFSWAPIMPLTDKYQVVWSATENLDGSPPVRFNSVGTQTWEVFHFNLPRDMNFFMQGSKGSCGCGPCQLHMDFEPHFCIVDIGDVGKVLEAYSEAEACSTTSTAGISPGTRVWNGGCAQSCKVDGDCVSDLGTEECVGGWCCDHTDLGEVIEVLNMFADITSPTCPQVCSPGACELPAPADCCRDAGYFNSSLQNQGTTYADCCTLGGNYLGDGTACAGSSLLPVCNTP